MSNKTNVAVPTVCKGCGSDFPSKSALFRHLKDSWGGCLPAEEKSDFIKHIVRPQVREKAVVLYGYWIGGKPSSKIKNGEDVARALVDELEQFSLEQEGRNHDCSPGKKRKNPDRSYGTLIRRSKAVAQEDGTSAITELLTIKLPPLPSHRTLSWINEVNDRLQKLFIESGDIITIMGRQKMPLKCFSAEGDVTHRRVEYLLPADVLFPTKNTLFESVDEFGESFPPLEMGIANRGAHDLHISRNNEVRLKHYSGKALSFLRQCKLTMQLLSTSVDLETTATSLNEGGSFTEDSGRPNNIASDRKSEKMKRRYYHNFTPRLMAHEHFSYRRLDRFHHSATLRFEGLPRQLFFSLSLSGDMFLLGQPCRVIGLFVALMRGIIDPDIVDCVFDEAYPNLVPTPPIPSFGLFARDVVYSGAEGKAKKILTPRFSDRHKNGWSDCETLDSVRWMQKTLREKVAQKWAENGVDTRGRLVVEKQWTSEVLLPWAEKARAQLEDYREWKRSQRLLMKPTKTINAAQSEDQVPASFCRVLRLLQEIDMKGQWPTTTPKRQLVMVSTETTETGGAYPLGSKSLLIACRKANSCKKDIVSSPYSYHEGEGGASGSFSVGFMPDEKCGQPKMNARFPDLTKAAFELERAICPNRPPSSTIAINRNAQFRPHTDSGAGAGQSQSLIVGLGSYEGGELVLEGDKMDIRYKPLEFDGWNQRHWTMPFTGERYSLVWFTPKGCEGLRGIDL